MKFYLISHTSVSLKNANCVKISIPVAIQSDEKPEFISTTQCSGMMNLLGSGDTIDRNIEVTINIAERDDTGRDYILLKGNILGALNSLMNNHSIYLKLVAEIVSKSNCEITTKEVSMSQISSESIGHEGADFYPCAGRWQANHRHSDSFIRKGSLRVTAICYSLSPNLDHVFRMVNPCDNRRMLEEEANTDMSIITQEGAAVKCHKSFLAVHSPVFQTMFQDNYQESQSKTVEMPDLTEASVNAFLAYLYCFDKDKVRQNSNIAVQLLNAGHKYDIPSLEMCMKNVLLSKPDNWFEVDAALQLFLFARNAPGGEKLKQKSVKILKRKDGALRTSTGYLELFKKNPEAAMELCECAFKV